MCEVLQWVVADESLKRLKEMAEKVSCKIDQLQTSIDVVSSKIKKIQIPIDEFMKIVRCRMSVLTVIVILKIIHM